MTFLIPAILALAIMTTGAAQIDPRSFLEPPRAEIATAGYPARGPATAPVTIVEFSDFECPFCGGLFPTLKAVEKIYLNRVRIVYRQFPLRKIHPRRKRRRKRRYAPTSRAASGTCTTRCSAIRNT